MTRLFYAYQGLPAPKSGQVYDIEKELPGLLGWRLIKIDPIRGLDFKITQYDKSKGELLENLQVVTQDYYLRLQQKKKL